MVKIKRGLFIGMGLVLVLAVAVGLASASDSTPTEEPASSPYFDATLQQAVDELDGQARAAMERRMAQSEPTQHFTTDPNVWDACEFGFTRDLSQWPWCHYTSDPKVFPECRDIPPWPTKDYTWDSSLWADCDTALGITRDPNATWCDPLWTSDPATGIYQCEPEYTKNVEKWAWCQPRYTWDPAQWPDQCASVPPYYTDDPKWPECEENEFTTDPYLWGACHFTSDPQNANCVDIPSPDPFAGYPTQDYTSNTAVWPRACPPPEPSDPKYTASPDVWEWCDPKYTTDSNQWPVCKTTAYTRDPSVWDWCRPDEPLYTSNPVWWPQCHYTSEPQMWDACVVRYPTKDYTWDPGIWDDCIRHTEDTAQWPWCDPLVYTTKPDEWPWCNPAWTWDTNQWVECKPGYTKDPEVWVECAEGLYTEDSGTWPACGYATADARIWPRCHFTSDLGAYPDCDGIVWPTKDFTTDPDLWPQCNLGPAYTNDASTWPACHYTSDPVHWPECADPEDLGDLGDAPDSTNHAGTAMTAYALGGVLTPARYPSVYDVATGDPEGPKHWLPRADAWLGRWVTREYDADLLPDEDPASNLNPAIDVPDRDWADDGLPLPVPTPFCDPSVFTYTVTITPGATVDIDRYVNVWFDWNRDGDWEDIPECPDGTVAPEWAVQDHLVTLGPGTHVLTTPAYLPWRPVGADFHGLWMRISIAEQKAPRPSAVSPADGRGPPGGYEYGETEDYFLEKACHEIPLRIGWNLHTLPLVPQPMAEEALDEIEAQGGYASPVYRWLSLLDSWEGHIKDLPVNNFPMKLAHGYFFYVQQPTVWTRCGLVPPTPVPVSLNPVWTLMGVPRLPCPMKAENLLQDATAQGGNCTEVYRWNKTLGAWEGHVIGLPFANFDIKIDDGYFVKCANPILYIPGWTPSACIP